MTIRGELGAAEIERLHAAFRAKIQTGACEVCGSHKWDSSPHLTSATIYDARRLPASKVDGFVPYILASFSCANCGNTKSFDINKLGFMPDRDEG